MMTCPECDREMFADHCPCGYSREPLGASFRSTYHAVPDGITRDHFGRELYRAIRICGGILQLQDMQKMERVTLSGRQEDYKQKEHTLHKDLAAMVPILTVDEQQQLVARYPKLFGRKR